MKNECATVEIGVAAGTNARVVAYASIAAADGSVSTVRTNLRLTVRPALRGRDVGYAALHAAASAAIERGVRRATFRIDDASLADDLREHRAVPAALAIPYVTLRCLLNRFDEASVVAAASRGTRDLTARARAEVALAVAA